LLKLRGKDLLQRKILRLMHPRSGHTWSLLSGERQASRLRAACFAAREYSRFIIIQEHDLLIS
jgi:hypothetical protein